MGARRRAGLLVGGWTCIAVAVPQDFMQDVAELPAEDGVAGQREAQRVGPEGVGALLPVSPQDDACVQGVKEEQPPLRLLLRAVLCSAQNAYYKINHWKSLF